MSTVQIDHFFTRGNAWKPGVLELYTLDTDGITRVSLPVSAFATDISCTVRKKPAVAQPDDTDSDVVGRITLVPSAHGVITVVGPDQLQLLFHGAKTKTWNTQNEYFYEVKGTLLEDGEPYSPVKGRLVTTWSANQT